MRVNSPGLAAGGSDAGGGVGGADGVEKNGSDAAGAEYAGAGGSGLKDGAGGAGAEFPESAPKVCVKLPGAEGCGGAEKDRSGAAGGAYAGGGVAGANDEGGAGAAGAGSDESAPNICVKLPGVDGCGAAGGGTGLANEGAGGGGDGGSGLACGAPWFRSEASRSSSLRGGVEGDMLNMPVALEPAALDEFPGADSAGEFAWSKGDLGASMGCTLSRKYFADSGFQDYIGFA